MTSFLWPKVFFSFSLPPKYNLWDQIKTAAYYLLIMSLLSSNRLWTYRYFITLVILVLLQFFLPTTKDSLCKDLRLDAASCVFCKHAWRKPHLFHVSSSRLMVTIPVIPARVFVSCYLPRWTSVTAVTGPFPLVALMFIIIYTFWLCSKPWKQSSRIKAAMLTRVYICWNYPSYISY